VYVDIKSDLNNSHNHNANVFLRVFQQHIIEFHEAGYQYEQINGLWKLVGECNILTVCWEVEGFLLIFRIVIDGGNKQVYQSISTIHRRNTKVMYKQILTAVFDICCNRFGQTRGEINKVLTCHLVIWHSRHNKSSIFLDPNSNQVLSPLGRCWQWL
jgi:hypothetical protein